MLSSQPSPQLQLPQTLKPQFGFLFQKPKSPCNRLKNHSHLPVPVPVPVPLFLFSNLFLFLKLLQIVPLPHESQILFFAMYSATFVLLRGHVIISATRGHFDAERLFNLIQFLEEVHSLKWTSLQAKDGTH